MEIAGDEISTRPLPNGPAGLHCCYAVRLYPCRPAGWLWIATVRLSTQHGFTDAASQRGRHGRAAELAPLPEELPDVRSPLDSCLLKHMQIPQRKSRAPGPCRVTRSRASRCRLAATASHRPGAPCSRAEGRPPPRLRASLLFRLRRAGTALQPALLARAPCLRNKLVEMPVSSAVSYHTVQ